MSHSLERTTVDTGAATVERTVERKDRGVTAEYALTTDADGPVGVRVEQGFTDDPIEDVGFHPDHTPPQWESDAGSVTFEVVVRPDEPTTAVLGLVTEDVHDGLLDGEPRILRAERVDPSTLDPDADSVFVRTAEQGGDRDGGGFLADVKRLVLGGSADDTTDEQSRGAADAPTSDREVTFQSEPDGEASDGESSEGVVIQEAESADDSAETSGSDETSDSAETSESVESGDGEPEAEAEVEGATPDAEETTEPVDVVERVVERDDTVTDVTEPDTATDESEGVATGQTNDDAVETETGSEEPETAEGAPVPADADDRLDPDESLVERLVAELEAGEADEGDRAALRDALGVGAEEATEGETESDAEGDDGRESVSVRLGHVQSRMDDFAAYADVLEEIIDEHGTDFMTDTATRLDALDSELDEVRTAADEAHEERAALRDDVTALRTEVDDLRETVDDLREDVSALREDLDDLETTHETRVRRLEDDVEMLASDAREGREALRDDVSALRREVHELKKMRDALSSALGGSGEEL